MKKIVRVFCLLLACVFCLTNVTVLHADSLKEKYDNATEGAAEEQENADRLEEEIDKNDQEKKELEEKVEKIALEIKDATEELEKKQLEIAEVQDGLDEAKINERKQYEAMKLRIQFMYEQGDSSMFEILMKSKSITDLLNKAEYIKKTSEYDREKLLEFQEVVKKIEEIEKTLEEEEKELQELQDKLLEKQDEANELLKNANMKAAALEKKLGDSKKKIKDLLDQAARAKKQLEEEQKKQQQQAQSNNNHGGGNAGASQIIGNGELAWPTTSQRVTSRFGWRPVPVAGATSWHDAIDIGAPIGTPVYAVKAGTVITAKWGYNGGRGVYIMVDHGDGLVTRYQHLSDMYVSVGQKVSKGQNIAAVGNTGASSGPHLDYAIYVNGQAVDPLKYY